MRITLKLTGVSYSGWSIGRDVRLEITAGGGRSVLERRMRPLFFFKADMGLGAFDASGESVEIPIHITVAERDRVYPDFGETSGVIRVENDGELPKESEYVVEVVERRMVFWKAKAVFTLRIEARLVAEETPQLRLYRSFNGEDYNRYDTLIQDAVAYWNNEFARDTDPPPELLDPNVVKAIAYQETRVGNDEENNGLVNIMQVGNTGDPSLPVLRGEQPEWWIHNGTQIRLQYDAKIESPRESAYWGVRWLYHKAQSIRKDGRREWRPWREAVRRYGPPRREYAENVWSIYTKGIDTRERVGKRLWSFIPLVLLVIPFLHFSNYATIELIRRDFDRNFLRPPGDFAGPVEVRFSASDPSLFFAIAENIKGWSEDLHVGRIENGTIRWLPMRGVPEDSLDNAFLSTRFLRLKGFDEPVAEIYGMTHRGHGSLYLFRVGERELVPILKTHAVDIYNEDVWRPGGYPEYGRYDSCGKVYKDEKLDASYRDINGDGVDDVTLSGTVQVMCTDMQGDGSAEWKTVLAAEEPVSETHLLSP